ncbi:GumC family protein [Lutimaribacter marinistellae]|uniref:GumC family protein n=1 Tax=Lutimaribacter marinistellae TaxID=1820329 RepID=A0ABV7TBU2_9RHOB
MTDSKLAQPSDRPLALGWLAICRSPLSALSWRRILTGGRLTDAGRLPRYAAIFLLGASALWAPIFGYLATAPLKYSSYASLILPGSGASASVNLNDIGQASSYANSAFSNGSISPTETYKRLIAADRILNTAAETLGRPRSDFGAPRVTLVDQTSLIHIEVKDHSPEAAQEYGQALISAFFDEIDKLRSDELSTREESGVGAIEEYTRSVRDIRQAITDLQARSGLTTADQYHEQVAALDRLKQTRTTLEGELGHQSQQVATLEAALNLPPNSAAATLKLYADGPYLALLDDVSAHAATVAQAGASYGPRHPTRIKAQEAYDAARNAATARAAEVTGLPASDLQGLDRAPEGQRAALLSELVRENARRAGIDRQIETVSARIKAEDTRLAILAPLAAELEDRQRDFAVAEAVFASAIARTESTKTDIYASYPLIQVLENPSLPDHPSSPRRKLALAAGVAATFMLLMGLVLAWIRKPLISRLIDPAKADPV